MDYYSGKVIVITGAGSGIGRAMVYELMKKRPQKLIAVDLVFGESERHWNDLGYIDVRTTDVSSESQMKTLFDEAIERNGRIDIVFNNAGVAAGGEFQDTSFGLWDRTMRVNLWGALYGSHFAYRKMVQQGYGHIINTASLGGLIPEPMACAYSASKYAVVGMSLSLRDEAFALGVRVSVVCPGVVNTPILDKAEYAGAIDAEKLKSSALEHGAMTPERCAEKILRKVPKNKGIILVKPSDGLFWGLFRVSPGLLSRINRLIADYFRKNFRTVNAGAAG